MRIEEWCGYRIRFVEHNGEWWAVLKDICDALDLKSFKVAQRLDPSMLERIIIDVSDIPLKDNRSRGENKTRQMLVVNEIGIYEALFASRRLEARKFRMWSASVMQRLRSYVGLQGYEALKLTNKEVQDQIDSILDCIFWDEERKELMISVTIEGGDVDQVPFDEYMSK
jgi:prophage antirepressor-like protein